jgi:hypothetical protein
LPQEGVSTRRSELSLTDVGQPPSRLVWVISVGFDMSATCPVRSRSRTCRRHGRGVFRAGIQRSVDKGWLVRHESGTYVKFTPAGAELFA